MSRLIAFTVIASLLPVPLLAGPPPAKRPTCQGPKAAAVRDAKRIEPCRKPSIPPVIDMTPMFLASTAATHVVRSDLS